MRTLIAIILMFVSVSTGFAEIIFSETFDSQEDWTSQQTASDYAWPSTWEEDCTTYCPPTGWTYYGNTKTDWDDDDPRNDTYIIDSTSKYGDTGKGITYWHEATGDWTGGDISKWLGGETLSSGGYSEIYVQFKLKYPSNFAWNNGSGHGQQKLTETASFPGPLTSGVSPDQYFTAGWNAPVAVPMVFYFHSGDYLAKLGYAIRKGPNYQEYGIDTTFAAPASAWPTDAQWHTYEYRLKLNSAPGATDGIFTIWLDGEVAGTLTSVPYVEAVAWQASYNYGTTISSTITPRAGVMIGYRVTTDNGTSGETEPDWEADCPNIGDTCSDGDLVWQAYSDFKWRWFQFLNNMYTSHDDEDHTEFSIYCDDIYVSTEYIGDGSSGNPISSTGTFTGGIR